MAGMGEYREISSISYCGRFQTENLKTKWIDQNGNKHLAHSLNGTCLAVGRLLAAIMEFYQKDHVIEIPSVLHKYLNFTTIDLKLK
jgi:seryl-tRNA synthetase